MSGGEKEGDERRTSHGRIYTIIGSLGPQIPNSLKSRGLLAHNCFQPASPASHIPRQHRNTLSSSPTLHAFLCQPSSVECCSQCTSCAMALFSHGVHALLIILVGHWHSDAILHYLHIQSCPIMSGLSKLMLAGSNSQCRGETDTMPLPNPSIFVG